MRTYTKRLVLLACLYIGGIVALLFTNPQNLPLPLLISPFIYIFITLYLTVKLVVTILFSSKSLGTSVGVTVSIFVVLSLVLASIRQLSARDLLISLAITIILSWYLVKVRKL